jgi:hypothetical protein
MEVPVGLVHNFTAGQFEDRGVHQAILVLGRTAGEAPEQMLAIEGQQYVIRIHEIQRHARLVFREPIHTRWGVVTDRRQIDSSGGFGGGVGGRGRFLGRRGK